MVSGGNRITLLGTRAVVSIDSGLIRRDSFRWWTGDGRRKIERVVSSLSDPREVKKGIETDRERLGSSATNYWHK